jgi:hypothetical protein
MRSALGDFLAVNLLTLVCKLDLFTGLKQSLLALIKRSSLLKSVRKFMPKKLYEIGHNDTQHNDIQHINQ